MWDGEVGRGILTKIYIQGAKYRPLGRWKTFEFLWILPFWYFYLLHILRSIICSRVPMGATNMRVPGRNIYMSVHGGVSTHNFVYTNIFVCRFSRIQYPKNQPIDASWHDSCHIASGPCIVVPAYLFIQACSFLRLFRHNFAENGPQDLKMVLKIIRGRLLPEEMWSENTICALGDIKINILM